MAKKIDIILTEALIERGLIPKKEIESLLEEADSSGQSLQQVIVKLRRLTEKEVLKVMAEKLNLSCIDLKAVTIDKSVINKVPLKIASYYKFFPLQINNRVLTIAVSSPLDIKTQDEIRTQLGFDIEIVLSSSNEIIDNLKKYYGLAADTLERISSQAVIAQSPALQEVTENIEDIEKLAEDASVIKLVNQIILDAFKKRATDIHIEPYRDGLSLRYRVDGILYDANVPKEMHNFLNAIISRIKIMSNLNIVERRLPQDGRAVVKTQEQVLDLRVSTIPTPHGESVVIRILPTQMLFSMEKLGLAKRDLQIFETLIQKPHGIIFVTGPTGSGKTTTLYACLSRINTKDRKIITIEDPIEYEMSGITQIQVMPEIGLDFARGLRSMLRHDPDIMMVGEVRDLETAEIAIRVALTGHLVFSTLHTNDAASGVTRLLDIGVEPFLASSSIEALIAQRLVRLICQECKIEDKKVAEGLKEMISADLGLKSEKEVKAYKGKGCPACNYTGFFGRTAIYEILLIDDAIRELMLKKSSSEQIKKRALSRGMRTLRQDGWQKVISGTTTPEEVLRVTSAEEEIEVKRGKSLSFASSDKEESETNVSPLERRAYSRLSRRINLRFQVIKSEEELIKKGYTPEQLSITKDISAGGLVFVSDEPVALGSVLEFKIELPGAGEPVGCLGRVVRVEEVKPGKSYDIAICFLDITGSDRVKLNKYVENEREG